MKLILILVGIVFLAVTLVVPLSRYGSKQAFAHPEKPWAPGLAANCGRALTYASSYQNAREILQKTIQVFPAYPRMDRLYFLTGLCYEKDSQNAEARKWYNAFLQRWPAHEWTDQIKKRIADLDAIGNG